MAALKELDTSKWLWKVAHTYGIPVETLRRRVEGKVSVDCRSGPSMVLTTDEKMVFVKYWLTPGMGLGGRTLCKQHTTA